MTCAWKRLCAASAVVLLGLAAAPVRPIQFTDTNLGNGLRVIISEDHAAPVFSIVVNYNVGSRDERKGRTGFAHLFEHMMFKGSENVGQNEHPYLIFMNGGTMNGTTNKDRTMYYETLPANQLDLGLFLEADRMRSLTITADNLENQRNAVQEERRLGVDNQPYGKTFEAIDELAYENFAYEHSVIGSMADLSAAGVDDVAAFFKMYYAPNNAVIAIVGDVDTKPTLLLNGVYLVVEVVLGDCQRLHAVCFKKQRKIDLVRRQRLVVQRPVLVRGPVHVAAIHEHEVGMLILADVLRAFEHHVLEEVREAGSSLALVTGTDVVVDHDREDRRCVVFDDDDTKPVRERRVGQFRRRGTSCTEQGAGRQKRAGCGDSAERRSHESPPK